MCRNRLIKPMNYFVDAACGSDTGRVRINNEDNFYFNGVFLPQDNVGQSPPLTFSGLRPADECLAVFDGMGGGEHGEAASFAAAKCLCGLLREGRGGEEVEAYLEQISEQTNQAVFEQKTLLGASCMGTTQAVLYFHDSRVYACNVGDSRIFGLRGDRLLQISRDHTDGEYMREKGITGRRPRLTQHLGMDPASIRLEPYITQGILRTGDVYLICSDGLTDMVEPERICRILSGNGCASDCAEQLIRAALEGGGRDNVTVIVIKILKEITTRRDENGTDQCHAPVAPVGDGGNPGLRRLWNGVKNAAETFRRKL